MAGWFANLILTVEFHDVPWIAFEERVQVTPLVAGFFRLANNCVIELGTRVQI